MRLGFQKHYFFGKNQEAPVTTIFSAPNYCGKGNQGAYIYTEGESLEINQFDEAKNKPYFLKGNANAFSYYMIDLSIWIDEFLYVLFDHLNKITPEEETKNPQLSFNNFLKSK